MSVYRIYNQGEIARFVRACPGPRARAFARPEDKLRPGLALGYRSGTRPQLDHHPRLDDARDGAPAA